MTNLTHPQDNQARKDASDPRINVTLEASAGTGKTRVLVDRYIRLIEAGAAPRNILAITFTRKAASEMKHRIIQELHRRSTLWDETRDRLAEVHIVTMDAFCLGLLKEFPLEANLEPDVTLLSAVELHRFLEESIEHCLSDHRNYSVPNLKFLISYIGEAALRRGMRHFIRNRLSSGPLLNRFIRQKIPHTLHLNHALIKTSTSIQKTLRCHQWETMPTSIRRIMNSNPLTPFDLEQVASYFLTQSGQPRKKLPHSCQRSDFTTRAEYDKHHSQFINISPVIAEHIRLWRHDIELYAIQEMWTLYQSATQHFTLLKEEGGWLDFSDIVQHAVTLLNQRGSFSQSRFRLESRYHHLLIDEFQDTNEMQWSLIQSLIDSWGEGAGLVQDAIAKTQASSRGKGFIQEPSIFLVGDRKQSIYGWRGARVEVMNTATKYLMNIRPNGGRKLHINQSFRAHAALLEFLNDVFSGIPKEKEDVNWAFRYPQSDHFPILDPDAHKHAVGIAIAPTRTHAATAVGDEIVRLLQETDCQPKDIAICFRSRTHYRVYEDALAQRGVPTYVYHGLGFYDSPEVRDIQALIRYLANPLSELRTAEILRSRFIGLSDTALALIANGHRKHARDTPLAHLLKNSVQEKLLSLRISTEDQAIITAILPKVTKWLNVADQIPPSDLLQRIIEETDYAAHFIRHDGIQGWENLKKVLELIRRAQNRGYMTFSRLTEYLKHSSSGEESLATLEEMDAVSLMTIHASKGLEFKAVFIVNMDQTLRTDTSLPRIKEHADGTIKVYATAKAKINDPDRVLEEEKRLLYVALTRAKSYLVLSWLDTKHKEHHPTFYNLLPKSLRELLPDATTTDATELIWNNKHRLRIIPTTFSPNLYHKTKEIPVHTLATEPLLSPNTSKIIANIQDTKFPEDDKNKQHWKSFSAEMERTINQMFTYETPREKTLEQIADTLLSNHPEQTLTDREKAVSEVTRFYRQLHAHKKLSLLLQDGTVSREVPFVLIRDNQKIRGTIDNLILLQDHAIVISYKMEKPSEKHHLQMEVYLEATKTLFPKYEIEGLIFYPNEIPRKYSL